MVLLMVIADRLLCVEIVADDALVVGRQPNLIAGLCHAAYVAKRQERERMQPTVVSSQAQSIGANPHNADGIGVDRLQRIVGQRHEVGGGVQPLCHLIAYSVQCYQTIVVGGEQDASCLVFANVFDQIVTDGTPLAGLVVVAHEAIGSVNPEVVVVVDVNLIIIGLALCGFIHFGE